MPLGLIMLLRGRSWSLTYFVNRDGFIDYPIKMQSNYSTSCSPTYDDVILANQIPPVKNGGLGECITQ